MLAQLLSPFRRRPARAPRSPRRAILSVECLEERAVPAVTVNPTRPTLHAATVGSKYTQNFTASPTASYTFSETGTLPAGLTLSSAGKLSGTPTGAGSFTFTVTATPTTGTAGSRQYTLVVNLALAPTTLPAASAGDGYSQTITASGGTSPYHFTISSGRLPSGLTLNTTTGVLSGTPLASGTFRFIVKATDSSTGTGAPFSGSRGYTLTVKAALVTILNSLPGVALGAALPTFQVKVQDAGHNALKGVTVTLQLVTVAAVDQASFTTVSAVTGANGVATFSGVSVGTRGFFEIEAVSLGTAALSNEFGVGLNGRHSPA
jgi:hypothetical protein